MKKIISILLALTLALSVTTFAWADGATVSSGSELKTAVKAATEATQTYTLSDNITIGEDTHDAEWGYEIRFAETATSVTIDGQNHQITLAGRPTGYSWPNQTGSSPAGFTFVGVDPNNSAPAGKTITFINVKFVNNKDNSKTDTKSERTTSYIYARAENVIYKNCTFTGGVVVSGNAKFEDCTFTETDSNRYCLFIDHEYAQSGQYTYELNNCVFDGSNTAYGLMKVAADRGADIDVKVEDTTFKNVANKPAIYVNGDTELEIGGEKTKFENCKSSPSDLGTKEAAGNTPEITVTGGSYTQDVTDYIPNGTPAATEGTTYVVGSESIASAANNGSNVTIIKGGTITGINDNVTVTIAAGAGDVTINDTLIENSSVNVTFTVSAQQPEQPEQPDPTHTNRRYPAANTTTTPTETKKDDAISSAKTFDAGVALYVGMALTSVTGMAWVGKKRGL